MEQLTLYAEGFHALTSAELEKWQDSPDRAADYGAKCVESLARQDWIRAHRKRRQTLR